MLPDGIVISEDCDKQEFTRTVRMEGLLQYNMEKTGGKLMVPDVRVTRVARDPNGDIIGGVTGYTYLSALEVEVLWLDERFRGRGIAAAMLGEIEKEAKAAGCTLAHLTTYSFQAPQFYQRQGYTICGEIDGFPDGIKLYTLSKRL